jgi:hypothetical protein
VDGPKAALPPLTPIALPVRIYAACSTASLQSGHAFPAACEDEKEGETYKSRIELSFVHAAERVRLCLPQPPRISICCRLSELVEDEQETCYFVMMSAALMAAMFFFDGAEATQRGLAWGANGNWGSTVQYCSVVTVYTWY